MAEILYVLGILFILIGFAKMLNEINRKGQVVLILLMAFGIAFAICGAHMLK